METRDGLYENFKEKWLTEYLVSLREKDRASFHSPRKWGKGEIALFKLPSKTRTHWPLVRIVETFLDDEGVIRTVRIVRSDGNESNVNVSYLIPLELYSELNNPNLYTQADEQEVEGSEVFVENISDPGSTLPQPGPSPTLPQPDSSRPSRSTALASRAQIKALAREGRL